MSDDPKYRRPLNDDQIKVLQLLYRFRFATSDLVAQYFGKKHGDFVYNRLKVLVDQGLIGKRFDKSYRIAGKPAAYYLLPTGARKLQELNPSGIYERNLYKEPTVGEKLVVRCLGVLMAYNYLRFQYGDQLTFSTKSDLANIESFPHQLPDAFIRLQVNGTNKCFFLDIYFDNQPFFEMVRKIKGYLEYKDSAKWSLPADFPVILSICESSSLQKRLLKRVASELKSSWHDDVRFAVTTQAVLAENKSNAWHISTKPNEALSLELIL